MRQGNSCCEEGDLDGGGRAAGRGENARKLEVKLFISRLI